MYMVKVNFTVSNFVQVMNGHGSTDDIMRDFCDGKAFKTHPLFSTKINALQILFYFDDVEVCNPLGSKRKIHKLSMFIQ